MQGIEQFGDYGIHSAGSEAHSPECVVSSA
jgi:hypothetical protein